MHARKQLTRSADNFADQFVDQKISISDYSLSASVACGKFCCAMVRQARGCAVWKNVLTSRRRSGTSSNCARDQERSCDHARWSWSQRALYCESNDQGRVSYQTRRKGRVYSRALSVIGRIWCYADVMEEVCAGEDSRRLVRDCSTSVNAPGQAVTEPSAVHASAVRMSLHRAARTSASKDARATGQGSRVKGQLSAVFRQVQRHDVNNKVSSLTVLFRQIYSRRLIILRRHSVTPLPSSSGRAILQASMMALSPI